LTVCVKIADVLLRLSALPEYTAVIECAPWVSADVEIVAFPLASEAVPTVAAPFLNVTDPVGVPLPGATVTTVIVKVTDLPSVDGFSEEVRVVELAALLTVCVSAEEVLVP
jgi:hypothetical protein